MKRYKDIDINYNGTEDTEEIHVDTMEERRLFAPEVQKAKQQSLKCISCPQCGTPNSVTKRDYALGYLCVACENRKDEQPPV